MARLAGILLVRGVEPLDPGLRAEPGSLALREADVPARVLAIAASTVIVAVEDRPRLAVADRGEGRKRRVEALA